MSRPVMIIVLDPHVVRRMSDSVLFDSTTEACRAIDELGKTWSGKVPEELDRVILRATTTARRVEAQRGDYLDLEQLVAEHARVHETLRVFTSFDAEEDKRTMLAADRLDYITVCQTLPDPVHAYIIGEHSDRREELSARFGADRVMDPKEFKQYLTKHVRGLGRPDNPDAYVVSVLRAAYPTSTQQNLYIGPVLRNVPVPKPGATKNGQLTEGEQRRMGRPCTVNAYWEFEHPQGPATLRGTMNVLIAGRAFGPAVEVLRIEHRGRQYPTISRETARTLLQEGADDMKRLVREMDYQVSFVLKQQLNGRRVLDLTRDHAHLLKDSDRQVLESAPGELDEWLSAGDRESPRHIGRLRDRCGWLLGPARTVRNAFRETPLAVALTDLCAALGESQRNARHWLDAHLACGQQDDSIPRLGVALKIDITAVLPDRLWVACMNDSVSLVPGGLEHPTSREAISYLPFCADRVAILYEHYNNGELSHEEVVEVQRELGPLVEANLAETLSETLAYPGRTDSLGKIKEGFESKSIRLDERIRRHFARSIAFLTYIRNLVAHTPIDDEFMTSELRRCLLRECDTGFDLLVRCARLRKAHRET